MYLHIGPRRPSFFKTKCFFFICASQSSEFETGNTSLHPVMQPHRHARRGVCWERLVLTVPSFCASRMFVAKALSPMPSKTDKSDIELLGEHVRGSAVPFPVLPLRLLRAPRIEPWRRCRGWERSTLGEYWSGASELPALGGGATELSLTDPPASDRFVIWMLDASDPWLSPALPGTPSGRLDPCKRHWETPSSGLC